jgi:hypothetical protein
LIPFILLYHLNRFYDGAIELIGAGDIVVEESLGLGEDVETEVGLGEDVETEVGLGEDVETEVGLGEDVETAVGLGEDVETAVGLIVVRVPRLPNGHEGVIPAHEGGFTPIGDEEL